MEKILLRVAGVRAEMGGGKPAQKMGGTGHWPVPSGDSPDGTEIRME